MTFPENPSDGQVYQITNGGTVPLRYETLDGSLTVDSGVTMLAIFLADKQGWKVASLGRPKLPEPLARELR